MDGDNHHEQSRGSLWSSFDRLWEALKLSLSLLYALAPSSNVLQPQPPVAIECDHNTDISRSIGVALLSVICRCDRELLDMLKKVPDLEPLVGIPMSDGLDVGFPDYYGDEVNRLHSQLLHTLAPGKISPPSPSPLSGNLQSQRKNGPNAIAGTVLRDRIAPLFGCVSAESLAPRLSEVITFLEYFTCILLGISHNDIDISSRSTNTEQLTTGKKKRKRIDRLSVSTLRFITSARPEVNCLIGSGVPRCLRMYSILQNVCRLLQLDDGTQHPPRRKFLNFAVALTTIGLGLLADNLKAVESRLSALDGFRILLHLPQFNSDVILLGLQKPEIIGDDEQSQPISKRTYISKSGKKKKVPGFRSSVGDVPQPRIAPISLIDHAAVDNLSWFPQSITDSEQIFMCCTNCGLQVRRTFPVLGDPKRRRIERLEFCLGCCQLLRTVRDVSISKSLEPTLLTPLDLSQSTSHTPPMIQAPVLEEGEIKNAGTRELENGTPVRTPKMTVSVLQSERQCVDGFFCWLRPSLLTCVSQGIENIENREGILHQLLCDHLTLDLLKAVMVPAETFSVPSDITVGAIFYPPGISAAEPRPKRVDWNLPNHGWILRLLDDLEDAEIRVGILDLLGELFLSRPMEYRTWHVRYISHIPVISSIYDCSSNVVRAALKAVLRSTALGPLKDGGIKRIVRLLELEDFALRFHLLCDILCRARYSDNKSIRLLIRGIMNGNSANRLLYARECWAQLVHFSDFEIKMDTVCQSSVSATDYTEQKLLNLPSHLVDNVDFHLDWGKLSGYSNTASLWVSLCARCCFTIGLNHPHLYESVMSALPESFRIVDDPSDELTKSGASGSSIHSGADIFTEVIGIVAFILGSLSTSMTMTMTKIIKGWAVTVTSSVKYSKKMATIRQINSVEGISVTECNLVTTL